MELFCNELSPWSKFFSKEQLFFPLHMMPTNFSPLTPITDITNLQIQDSRSHFSPNSYPQKKRLVRCQFNQDEIDNSSRTNDVYTPLQAGIKSEEDKQESSFESSTSAPTERSIVSNIDYDDNNDYDDDGNTNYNDSCIIYGSSPICDAAINVEDDSHRFLGSVDKDNYNEVDLEVCETLNRLKRGSFLFA